MQGNRHIRVGEAIREVLAEALMRGTLRTREPLAFTTVTGVEVTKDLREAKVFVSVYGTDAQRKTTMEALTKAQGFLRGEVGRALRTKHTPSLAFVHDASVERGARVGAAIREARARDDELARERGDAPAAAPPAKTEGEHG
ncbi:MAG: 30S ribosome-binding factor RbfA [Deltaproteobacteria bacterium]|nr:30S ribosome-binding factor RbfA [Deltaproteobacteria bacterium]